MRKYLIAGLLTVAFVTPALAEDFYVAVDLASATATRDDGPALPCPPLLLRSIW